MKRIASRTLAPVLALLAGLAAAGAGQAHEPYDSGAMEPGYGMRPGYGMGPGMMGPGMMGPGYGMMGQGHGMMGHGYGQGYGMGPGTMGPGTMGPGYGMGSQYGMRQALPRDLSADDVRLRLEHHLAWQNNPNLKLGKVEDKDADTIVAEIVTKEGSLVDRLEIDRHTGEMRRAN